MVSATDVLVQVSSALVGSSVREGLGAVSEVSEVLASDAVLGYVGLLADSMVTDKQGSEIVLSVISAAEGHDMGSGHGVGFSFAIIGCSCSRFEFNFSRDPGHGFDFSYRGSGVLVQDQRRFPVFVVKVQIFQVLWYTAWVQRLHLRL